MDAFKKIIETIKVIASVVTAIAASILASL